MKIKILGFLVLLGLSFVACKKDDVKPDDQPTTQPVIVEIKLDKTTIEAGGEDPAVIECIANGGNLNYVWEVDLGDIFPLNESGSKVRFTGSTCCIGEKIIKCTVSNDKGSVSQSCKIDIIDK